MTNYLATSAAALAIGALAIVAVMLTMNVLAPVLTLVTQ
jgi:hypothetical protein